MRGVIGDMRRGRRSDARVGYAHSYYRSKVQGRFKNENVVEEGGIVCGDRGPSIHI